MKYSHTVGINLKSTLLRKEASYKAVRAVQFLSHKA